MWSREDLKARGKFAFQRNYWTAVAVSLIAAIVTGALTIEGNSAHFRLSFNWGNGQPWAPFENFRLSDIYGHIETDSGFIAGLVSLIVASVFGLIALLALLFKLLIGNAIKVGANRYYMENREHKTGVDSIFYGFRNGRYVNVTVTMFLVNLFTFLWSLLLVVPGIIKSYEYRMVPYILSENPGMHYRRAFEISRQMMDGQKMDTFILDLSYIGWGILSAFTCGILGLFYVQPYYDATNAELYAVFREHAFHTGQLSYGDLPGYSDQSYYGM